MDRWPPGRVGVAGRNGAVALCAAHRRGAGRWSGGQPRSRGFGMDIVHPTAPGTHTRVLGAPAADGRQPSASRGRLALPKAEC